MSDDTHLFWSRRGEIACARHAPDPISLRWADEAWQAMPDLGVRMVRYQCQHCDGVPLRSFPRAQQPMPLVLNVDDRPTSLYVRNRALRMHGFTVVNAETGRDAIEFARRLQPQLVLLDVHLPDMDGRQVCRMLKTDRQTATIPVVMISATLGREGEALRAEGSMPGDAFLSEPVDASDLASALRRLLPAS